MLEKRFDVFSVDSYKSTINGMRALINSGRVDDILEVYGNYTNASWEHCADFLSEGTDECLDIVKFYSDSCGKRAFLYTYGDIELGDCSLCYLVLNKNCDVIEVGNYANIEDLVNSINKEYEKLELLDKIVNKVDSLNESNIDKLTLKYGEKIDSDYIFENFSSFINVLGGKGTVHFNSLVGELVSFYTE